MSKHHCLLCSCVEGKISYRSLELGRKNIWIASCRFPCESIKQTNQKISKKKIPIFFQWRLMFFPRSYWFFHFYVSPLQSNLSLFFYMSLPSSWSWATRQSFFPYLDGLIPLSHPAGRGQALHMTISLSCCHTVTIFFYEPQDFSHRHILLPGEISPFFKPMFKSLHETSSLSPQASFIDHVRNTL